MNLFACLLDSFALSLLKQILHIAWELLFIYHRANYRDGPGHPTFCMGLYQPVQEGACDRFDDPFNGRSRYPWR